MDSYIIAKLLFVLASIFEILITFSIPWIYQDVYFPLFGISFTTTQMDGSASFVNSSSGFDGMINNTTVTELMIVIFGCWSACYGQANPGFTNDIMYACIPAAFGYPVVIEDASLNTTTTVVQTSFTTPLFILPIAATVTFVAAFMTGPYHYFVKALAILLSMGATFAELVLFNSVKKEVPRLGSLAVISQASGFYTTVACLVISVFALLVYVAQEKSDKKEEKKE